MVALLTALAPLLGSLGLSLINWFVKDATKKADALAVYQAALDKSKYGGSVSAGEKSSYDAQVAALEAEMDAKDKGELKPPAPKV